MIICGTMLALRPRKSGQAGPFSKNTWRGLGVEPTAGKRWQTIAGIAVAQTETCETAEAGS